MTKLILIGLLIFLSNIICFSNDLDSLKIELQKKSNHDNPELLNRIAKEYFTQSLDTAHIFAIKALNYSKKQKQFEQEAMALHNIGVIFHYRGIMDSALHYYNKSIAINSTIDNQIQIANSQNNIGLLYFNWGHLDKAIEYYTKSGEIKKRLNDKKGIATSLVNLGIAYSNYGNNIKSINYYKEAITQFEALKDSLGLASVYGNMGVIYKQMGDYEKAINFYLNSLKIREKLNDLHGTATTLQNIGGIYLDWKNYEEALGRFEKALVIFIKIEDKIGEAFQYNNMGLVYSNPNTKYADYTKAKEYLTKALNLFEETKYRKGIAQAQNDLGKLYFRIDEIEESYFCYNTALKIYSELDNKQGIINSLNNIGNNYEKSGKYDLAKNEYNKAWRMAKKINNRSLIILSLRNLKNVFLGLNDFQKAFYYSEIINDLNDSIFNIELHNQIAELEMIYETDKKEKEIILLNKDKALKENEIKQQKLIRNFAFLVIVFFIITLTILYNRYFFKRKINKVLKARNDEIIIQNKEITIQRDQIIRQKKNITDSIKYAQNIQEAVYPSMDLIEKIIPNHVIFYKPKDIVSGDFYWIIERNEKTYISAVDCTGHGVPGAFMSLLGVSFLNEIMSNHFEISANEILNKLREMIINSLHQENEESKLKDGMDMALCVFDSKSNILEYAGANNPIFLVRNKKIIELKPDLMPIGMYMKMENQFTKQEIKLQKNDIIYMFTDGYIDQFGGEGNRKFGSKAFKELLLHIADQPFENQKTILNLRLSEWKENYDQVDDILIMGLNFDK